MSNNHIISIGIICAAVIILTLWWIMSVDQSMEQSRGKGRYSSGPVRCGFSFDDLYNNFDTYPVSLWFYDSEVILSDSLQNSAYNYVIVDSDYRVIYNNRSGNGGMMDTFEITDAVVSGSGCVVRDKMRYLAIRVSSPNGEIRVVSIST